MNRSAEGSYSLRVLAAAGVVVVLLGLLAVRLVFRTSEARAEAAPAGSIAEPEAFVLGDLSVPRWATRDAETWPVEFKTDLDLLAPLGDGGTNAAAWFVDFTKPDGSRYSDAQAMMERRVEGPVELGKVLPADDPLLLEAEPWCDQATMIFYPEFFAIDGWETKIPNLLVPLTLAKSWVARGLASDEPVSAAEDFRRAIRLGRLLRQEDVTIIADLVGLACIRFGAEGMYADAVKREDVEGALIASIVLAEVAPQRLLTSERVTRVSVAGYLTVDEGGSATLDLPDERLDTAIEMARSEPGRRFRGEPLFTINFVLYLGTPSQQAKARALLDELSQCDDPILAELARWSRDTPPGVEALRESAVIR